jgi:hypothetical protein
MYELHFTRKSYKHSGSEDIKVTYDKHNEYITIINYACNELST